MSNAVTRHKFAAAHTEVCRRRVCYARVPAFFSTSDNYMNNLNGKCVRMTKLTYAYAYINEPRMTVN